LSVKRTLQASPTQTSAPSAIRPLPSQSKVGAAQYARKDGSARETASRYSPAGRSPRGPISPWISDASDQNADRKMSPRARRKIQRGQSMPQRTTGL